MEPKGQHFQRSKMERVRLEVSSDLGSESVSEAQMGNRSRPARVSRDNHCEMVAVRWNRKRERDSFGVGSPERDDSRHGQSTQPAS
jgi:hypothetical protein